MKATSLRAGLVTLVIILAATPANALVRDATYQAAIRERDEARRERDAALAKYEDVLKKMIEEAKTANPELRAAASQAQTEAVEAQRRANQAELQMEAEAARYSKVLTLWQTGAAIFVAATGLFALVAGVAIGTRTRRDFDLQHHAATPASIQAQ